MNLAPQLPLSLAGARVLVVGLGSSGSAAARVLLDRAAKVRVTESGSDPALAARAAALQTRGAEVELGGHDLSRLDADLAIMSPGIPPTAPIVVALAERGIEIWSEVELAFRLAHCDFLAVTGTNGKTTTTALLGAMLGEAGIPSAAAGNIGLPLVEAATSVPEGGAIAVEVSSFQLATSDTFAPKVAVLLNIAADHIDWHGSLHAYIEAKARIVANQTSADAFVVNAEDRLAMRVAERAPSRVVPFSSRSVPSADGSVGVVGETVTWRGRPIFKLSDVALHGRGVLEDAIAAAAAALEYGVERDAVVAALRAFRPLPHRLQPIADIDGVSYIDDSKATNPHATLAAVAGLTEVVLIAGGRSKGIDLEPLAKTVPPVIAVVAMGEAAEEIEAVFHGLAPVQRAASMDEAVRRASASSSRGGSVLLSPGCASLDMYESYAARGDAFARAVYELSERN